MKKTILVAAVLVISLLLGIVTSPEGTRAQGAVDYDGDDNGLIEIKWLEQLNAIRWDSDGDGIVNEGGNEEAYWAAFPGAVEGMGCPDRVPRL